MVYEKIPIVETARRCGLVIDSRTLRRSEVEAACPFCGDHGAGKYHMSLNTDKDLYRCNLCGAHSNSVSLYARIKGVSNKEAFRELSKEGKTSPFPQQPEPQKTERQPLSLEQRHAAYTDMLGHLTLLGRHRENLLAGGCPWSVSTKINTAVCRKPTGAGGFSLSFFGPAAMNRWACRGFVHTTANGPSEVVEAMDMDQMTNENVRKAVLAMRREVQTIPGIQYYKYTWNPAYKGVDDYLLSRKTAQM